MGKIIDFVLQKYASLKEGLAENFLQLWKYLYIRIYFALIGIIIIINFSATYYIYNQFDPSSLKLASLHYNIEYGVDLIGSASTIFILPLLGLLFFVINLTIANIFIKKENSRYFIQILFITTIVCNFFLLLGIYSLYLINFR